MSLRQNSWQAWCALVALVLAVIFPIVIKDGDIPVYLLGLGGPALVVVLLLGLDSVVAMRSLSPIVVSAILALGAHAGAVYGLWLLPQVQGSVAPGFWGLIVASWFVAWALVVHLTRIMLTTPIGARVSRLLVPALFGIWLLLMWEYLVRGFDIPLILMPPPSVIGAKIAATTSILWADFVQTFMKAVLAGYAIGCLAGFTVALAADRVPFMRRGLLPIGNLVAALPIIGIAPIMVMWFGFDWQSKAAVVAVMTFFPMLVNTVAGLSATDAMHRDLMVTYAAGPRQTLAKLKLPAALPFIFNGLKINTTLALIGAIVAEFFGTPIVGMGFRISTAIGRLAVDMVWAEIAVAALAGSAFYGVMALIERSLTFWHPSFRK